MECAGCGHEHLERVNCMTPITFGHFSRHLGKKQRGQFNCPCALYPLERRVLFTGRKVLKVYRTVRYYWWQLNYKVNPIVKIRLSRKKFW